MVLHEEVAVIAPFVKLISPPVDPLKSSTILSMPAPCLCPLSRALFKSWWGREYTLDLSSWDGHRLDGVLLVGGGAGDQAVVGSVGGFRPKRRLVRNWIVRLLWWLLSLSTMAMRLLHTKAEGVLSVVAVDHGDEISVHQRDASLVVAVHQDDEKQFALKWMFSFVVAVNHGLHQSVWFLQSRELFSHIFVLDCLH